MLRRRTSCHPVPRITTMLKAGSIWNRLEVMMAEWWSRFYPYVKRTYGEWRQCEIQDNPARDGGNLVARLSYTTSDCYGGAEIYATWTCPEGSTLIAGNKCQYSYFPALLNDNPPPKTCGLNPVELGGGKKYQFESDIEVRGAGQVSFSRYYTNQTNGQESHWRNNL